MIDPLAPPPKKDPQKRSRVPTAPPGARSRAALGLSAAAAEGRFMLQACTECGTVQYPPRDACAGCLSTALRWTDIAPEGTLLAETTVRTSVNVYFRERAPWRIGTVKLDAGPVIVCHLHADCERGAPVRMLSRLDKSGQGVLLAVPPELTPHFEDDPQWRELTCTPKFRRVLITDGRSASGLALSREFARAGASIVFVGESERWLPNPNREPLARVPGVELVPLDVSDTDSVVELAGEIGGKVDILVNNARFVRPGGILERGDVNFARNEMEVNYLGMMRVAQSFGPVMAGRGSDGVNSAAAWVNLLSVYALANRPDFGCFAASNAAALSLAQCLRAEMRAGGVRVVNVFSGPTEDEWHQPLPPPKVGASALGRAVLEALNQGLEDVYVGDVARDLVERWRANPKVLERELTDPESR
ncbi:MAG: SDR family NAD(P)-dependent oxidoreductase [Burkholderiales bacterium]|nr:MAG: SDR family NAD(P)-dependent oxidoreductase [Burkholderiales bacterium]